MKLLIVDQDGCGLAFAWRASLAGHVVRWFVKPSKTNDPTVGEGFQRIQKIDNWLSHTRWADLIFCTSNCAYMSQLERIKGTGVKFFGPSVASADLEIKRGEGMKFLEAHGIDVPPYKTFKTLQEAEKHVWKTEKRWVFKTLGDNEDKSLSYCSKSPADMISKLRKWQELGMNPKGEVMLQEFIPGIELGVSRWMGKDGWISPPNINWEHKKLMPGDHGPNTGEMATLMAYEKEEKLSKEMLDPIGEDLRKLGHLGDCDINCIVDEKGKAWPLEFTNRPGWPAFNLMMAQHKGDPVQWMLDACDGKQTLQVSYDAGCCIVLAIPKFPYSDSDLKFTSGVAIYGVTKDNRRYLQPQGVKIATMPDMDGDKVVERPIWVTAGDYVMVVTGTAPTVEKAAKRAYDTADEIDMPDKIMRTGIGDNMPEKLEKLHKMGYALGVNYGG
jgi:phosphoribosylamine--glycine ligase